MRSVKNAHVGQDVLLTCARWDAASLCSARQSEDRLQERGVSVAHAPSNRWLLQENLPLAEACQRRRHLVWISWRMAAPLSQSQGTGARSRAVEQHGHIMNLLLIGEHEEYAAKPFFIQRSALMACLQRP